MNMNVNIADGGTVAKHLTKHLDFTYFENWNFMGLRV